MDANMKNIAACANIFKGCRDEHCPFDHYVPPSLAHHLVQKAAPPPAPATNYRVWCIGDMIYYIPKY